MSDGYTPVFGSVFDGSLYGKWPDSAVWLTMLALCDKRGNVDMSFQAISGRTGWPMDLLVQGIGALMQPDPVSRSPAQEGRRLVALREGCSWGWHVVNHAFYREKARLQGKDAARVASGLDADRKRQERSLSPEVPRSPPQYSTSPEVPLSDSDSDSNKSKRARSTRSSRVPDDFLPDLPLARSILPDVDAEREAQKFRDWEFKTPRSDWPAAWRNWIQRCKERGEYAKLPKASAMVINGKPVEWQ